MAELIKIPGCDSSVLKEACISRESISHNGSGIFDGDDVRTFQHVNGQMFIVPSEIRINLHDAVQHSDSQAADAVGCHIKFPL